MKRIILAGVLTLGVFSSAYSVSASSIVVLRDRSLGSSLESVIASQKGGVLDATWASDGSMVYNVGSTDTGKHVLVAPDGSVFVAGLTVSSGFIAKFDKTGMLVPGFGTSGKVTNSTVTNSGFVSLALDATTNTLYALGDNGSTNSYVFAYNATTGAAVSGFSATIGEVTAGGLAIDSTGLYVLTSNGASAGSSVIKLRKLSLTTGTADATFNGGAAISSSGGYWAPNGIVAKNGYVYIAGGQIDTFPFKTQVKKVNASTGSVEWTTLADEDTQSTSRNTLTVDSQDNVYVSKDDNSTTGGISKITSSGTATSLISFSSSITILPRAIAVDGNDGLLLFGFHVSAGRGRVMRLNPGGASVDTSFGSNGILTLSDATSDLFHGVVAADGKIYAVGTESSNTDVVVARITCSSNGGTITSIVKSNKNVGNAQGITGRPL